MTQVKPCSQTFAGRSGSALISLQTPEWVSWPAGWSTWRSFQDKVEIIPGQGVALVRIGDPRSQVEERVGSPYHGPGGQRAVCTTSPTLVITYTANETVELVEIGYSGEGGDAEAHYDGVN
ncbi:hypothetical protein A6P39_034415 [Streptomyces sp. FXJ1.172]|uniref:hypothetical protein n=1 Tax=Streptomyces sp. FXJ1.172 TaxID=710705 RepID=UPI000B263D5E|nr:hypothetical protein [Streptomyces sp. FXJ1.172]WEO98728.1 hypothetical protein A6P39_034415 [Streptomyces sp. FXJ1.172]